MDKQNVVYTQNEILFTHKKESSTDSCRNKYELRSHIMIPFICNVQNRQTHRDKNQWLPGAGGGAGEMRSDCSWEWGDENVLASESGDIGTIL